MTYALLPHSGSWQSSGIPRYGLELVHPLIGRVVASHEGPLPPQRWGFLDLDASSTLVSSVKPARGGGVAVRVYESAGKPDKGRLLQLHASAFGRIRGQPTRGSDPIAAHAERRPAIRCAPLRDQDVRLPARAGGSVASRERKIEARGMPCARPT